MQSNMLFFGEIYTTGKDFTLPPAVTGVTNITYVVWAELLLKSQLYFCSLDCNQQAQQKVNMLFKI